VSVIMEKYFDKDLALKKSMEQFPNVFSIETLSREVDLTGMSRFEIGVVKSNFRDDRTKAREDRVSARIIFYRDMLAVRKDYRKAGAEYSRLMRIFQLKRDRWSLERIGKELGITRERVRQILAKHMDKHEYLTLRGHVVLPIKMVKVNCIWCGAEVEVTEKSFNNRKFRFYTCSACRIHNSLPYEERRKRINDRSRQRYALNLNSRKERAAMYAKRWKAKVMADPVKKAHFMELQAKNTKAWHMRNPERTRENLKRKYREMMADPVRRAAHRIKERARMERYYAAHPEARKRANMLTKKRYQLLKKDPVKWAALKERQRIYAHERYQRLKKIKNEILK
jgi:hypothetical protein